VSDVSERAGVGTRFANDGAAHAHGDCADDRLPFDRDIAPPTRTGGTGGGRVAGRAGVCASDVYGIGRLGVSMDSVLSLSTVTVAVEHVEHVEHLLHDTLCGCVGDTVLVVLLFSRPHSVHALVDELAADMLLCVRLHVLLTLSVSGTIRLVFGDGTAGDGR